MISFQITHSILCVIQGWMNQDLNLYIIQALIE